ncbi:choline-sulfatase [Hydrogenophaga sp.]|uniref:choline-sulfatase n=1 Tax=Hydrogenophaga sp. TaxID=1904254 RepID=UPI002623508B|nr:choline-sulfatase [Hydrogenophaga sp.]MDM7950178.1 choline-sulfatase [Hydrogenophaga sp.]
MSRPNILVIQADQLTAKVLPMYGGPALITPHMNRLAEQGVTFLNAYSNNPVCAPSRAAMLTGRLSSEVGCYDNAADMPSSTLTLAHYLRRQGYRTCLSGKMHFVGAEQLHGFEERVTTDIYPSDFGWTADWTQVKQPYSPSRMSLRSIVEAGLCERNLQIDYDEEVAYRAEQWLFDQARSDDKRPFLLWASFTHPHNPFITTKKFWDLYDHDKIEMPTVPFIPIADRDPWSKRYAYTIRADEHDVSEEQIRVARHAYYAMTSYFDAQVGRLLEVLDRTGSADNTFVFVVSDHGEMLGERGSWFKFQPFEWSVRVPMIAAGPGLKRGLVEERGVSLMDLLPTFNDLVSEGNPVAPVDRLSGTSLAGMLHGTDASRGDDVMMEFLGEGVYAPACILRKDGYKYVYCRHDPAMLFDLKADPDERTNLAGQPVHADVESRMHSEVLKRWDYSGLEKTILDSQQRRLFAQESLLQGSWTSWDYQPPADAARKYVRGAVDPNTTATKAKKRFPFVVAYPPDHPRDPAASLQLEPNADGGKMSRS